MANSRVSALTQLDILNTARKFQWNRQMPKWTVIVEGRELPARPLVLEAAGSLPNDPTNSHEAVALLQRQGFSVLYEGRSASEERVPKKPKPDIDELIADVRGYLKGEDSLLEFRELEHRIEKND